MNSSSIVFRQLFERVSCTYTYIVGCKATRKAAIIDPVKETADRDAKLLRELGLDLIYGLNTHVHADHITGTARLAIFFPGMQSVLSTEAGGRAGLYVSHRQLLPLGDVTIEVRHTPGHTNGCVSYVLHREKLAFTGDTLLIRRCGRTDFQQGSSSALYDSVWNELFSLPDDFLLLPGHDYEGHSVTTVDEEKRLNPRLRGSKQEFIDIMNSLKLAQPKLIDQAVPANLRDGELESSPKQDSS